MDELIRSFRAQLLGDERLAHLVTAGSDAAFSTLYKRYQRPLYRYCRSILRSDADAHDAVQSTFARAFEALRRGQRDAPVRPWLYRIAYNESVTLIRAHRAGDKLSGYLTPYVVRPEDRAHDREQLGSLLEDLRELPERSRGAILMRELGGLSHEEIAAALGTSVNGAKQAIFEARVALADFAAGATWPARTCARRSRSVIGVCCAGDGSAHICATVPHAHSSPPSSLVAGGDSESCGRCSRRVRRQLCWPVSG